MTAGSKSRRHDWDKSSLIWHIEVWVLPLSVQSATLAVWARVRLSALA
jgi:hypothetical protein